MIANNAKFLIIDDDDFIRQQMIQSLRSLDFTGPCTEASDGDEAIAQIRKNQFSPFDFIFCDVKMPNKDGLDFLKYLKNTGLLQTPTPIIMVTAENDSTTVVSCIKLGATNYILKPWSREDLSKRISASWIKIHRPK